MKYIKRGTTESVWEYDSHFKTLLSKLSYDIQVSQCAQWFIGGLIKHFRKVLPHKTYIDPCEVLKADLCVEVVGSIDIGVSPFLEDHIVVMAKQLEKLSTNLAHDMCSGIWCTDYEVEGHTKDSFPHK